MNNSEAQHPLINRKSRPAPPSRLQKWCIVCCPIWALIFIAIGIVFPIILPGLVKKVAEEGVVMVSDNEALWAHIPGATQTLTLRNYTIYNFTNPKQVIYQGQKPVFNQISGFTYIEYQDFENIQYSENGDAVNFDYWLHFDFHQHTRNTSQKVTVPNLGPLGFWYQLQTQQNPTFSIQGFGQLWAGLRDTLKDTVLGQGVAQQFLPTFDNFKLLTRSADIDSETTAFLWNDPINGLSNPDHYEIWVQAARDPDSGAYTVLLSYFSLETLQLNTLLSSIGEWTTTIQRIIDNWYCGEEGQCSGTTLALIQLNTAGITNNPPPGTDPIESICSQNHTCAGYPEFQNYLHKVFPQEYPANDSLLSVQFSLQQMSRWFVCQHQIWCLLHAGNLADLWLYGNQFDATADAIYLTGIKLHFFLADEQQALVFWYWVKYITLEFAIKQSKEGTKGIAGIGGVASQALALSFAAGMDWINDLYTSKMIAARLSESFDNCGNFIRKTIESANSQQVEAICTGIDFTDSATVLPWVQVCDIEYGQSWKNFSRDYNLTSLQMAHLCDKTDPSLKTILTNVQAELDDFYDCSLTPALKCSPYELMLKQWTTSQLTRRPIPEATNLKPCYSLHEWNNDIPGFQYKLYLADSGIVDDGYRPSASQLLSLLSYDMLFSGPVIQEMLLENNQTRFNQLYHWKNPEILKGYVKYITIEVGFGGFTQKRSVQDLIFGYEDDFLRTLRDMDPQEGGDPSIKIVISLNEPNATKEQAKFRPYQLYTGKHNVKETRYFKGINGTDKIRLYSQYWDGDEVVQALINPWGEDDQIVGTDAFQSAPGLTMGGPNNISIYIDSLYRYGTVDYNETIERFGMELYLCRVNPNLYMNKYDEPKHVKYYQEWQGFLNESTINGVPLFISKNHFLDAPSNWSSFVDIYDETGVHPQTANLWDDTYIQIQPTTGTSFCATIYLQGNYLYQPDSLFSNNSTMMFPIFGLYRSGNISQNAVDKYFGPLKLAKKIRVAVPIGLGVVACAMVMLSVGLYVKRKRTLKKIAQSPDPLQVSLQQNQQDQPVPQPVIEVREPSSIASEPEQENLGVQHGQSVV